MRGRRLSFLPATRRLVALGLRLRLFRSAIRGFLLLELLRLLERGALRLHHLLLLLVLDRLELNALSRAFDRLALLLHRLLLRLERLERRLVRLRRRGKRLAFLLRRATKRLELLLLRLQALTLGGDGATGLGECFLLVSELILLLARRGALLLDATLRRLNVNLRRLLRGA